jgi:hypothetical protein
MKRIVKLGSMATVCAGLLALSHAQMRPLQTRAPHRDAYTAFQGAGDDGAVADVPSFNICGVIRYNQYEGLVIDLSSIIGGGARESGNRAVVAHADSLQLFDLDRDVVASR